jgi:ribonuclease BN (tRNA processing enzyme)
LRLTVLGKSPSWQDADGACSGYLLEEGGSTVLLDCGNGVFSKLRRFRDYTKVDAVVISHLHADHFLDLVPFSYALTYAPRQQPTPVDRWPGTDNPARPLLFAPRGATECFRRVVGAWGNEDLIENAFDLREFTGDEELAVGSMRFTFQHVPHFTETFAIDIASMNGGGRITYGADCSPNEELVAFARDTDLLIVEATLPRPERTGIRGHLTPSEAAEHASRANVKRVLLTHVSDELDELWVRKCACRAFDGPVSVAREGAVYETGTPGSAEPAAAAETDGAAPAPPPAPASTPAVVSAS